MIFSGSFAVPFMLRIWSSGIWCFVTGSGVPYISNEHIVFILLGQVVHEGDSSCTTWPVKRKGAHSFEMPGTSHTMTMSFSRGPGSLITFLWKIWNLHLHHFLHFPLNFIAVCNCISACDENEEWSRCMVPCSQVCLYYDSVLKENGLCSSVEDCVPGKWV